jgi:hypothetical protein
MDRLKAPANHTLGVLYIESPGPQKDGWIAQTRINEVYLLGTVHVTGT